MKKWVVLFSVMISIVTISQLALSQDTKVRTASITDRWYEEPYHPDLPYTKGANALPLIQVKGNRLLNPAGDTILFHGVAIADLDKVEGQGHFNKELFVRIKELGANIVRLPVHPVAWRDRTPEKYLKLLDQAIAWCTDESLYVDIDWHSIGNLEEGLFQDASYNTSIRETFNFWKTIARHYAGHNTVAFIELFNEPTDFNGRLGTLSWEQWKTLNEHLIKLVRAYGVKSIPLVAGFDWAYDLTPLRYDPIDAEGIGYVVHPYPHKRTPPYVPKWEEDFGFAADKYPVVATELGFTLPTLQANLDYGRTIMQYFKEKHISWIWWVFDPDWKPSMFTSWRTFAPTAGGKFFEEAVHNQIPPEDSTTNH